MPEERTGRHDPILPRARKREIDLRGIDGRDIISPRLPRIRKPESAKSELRLQFVESARRLGDTLDNALGNFSRYYKDELEGKVEETLEDVTRVTRDLKTELGRRANEIGDNVKAIFRKLW